MIIVIRRGPLYNLTLAGTCYNKDGQRIKNYIVSCDTWEEGWKRAINLKADQVLFVDSGTVFNDIDDFLFELKNYPHQGLVGHIIDNQDGTFKLDQQCFLVNIKQFTSNVLTTQKALGIEAVRSEQNIHDNYTPLWLKPGQVKQFVEYKHFGQSLIDQQLMSNRIVSNWQNKMRGIKQFLYTEQDSKQWIATQKQYCQLAENQFWILNNEPTKLYSKSKLITPASGLCWIKNLFQDTIKEITLVDISKIQCKFVTQLLDHWDGHNYGEFVYNFLLKNQILNFNLDNLTVISKQQQIELIKTKKIIDIINDKFNQEFNHNFAEQWQVNKSKVVKVINDDLVKFLPVTDLDDTSVWASNVLDYKYTLLQNSNKELTYADELIRKNS